MYNVVLSRMLASLYSTTLLSVFLSISMSVIAKSLYRQNLLAGYSRLKDEDLASANRNFICIAARFVQNGVAVLAESVRNSVRAIFSKVPFQEPTTLTLLSSLLGQVRYEIESTCGRNTLSECLFGDLDEMVRSDMSPTRRSLFMAAVNETRLAMKSDAVKGLLQEHVSRSLDRLVNDVCDGKTIPFISVLPKIARLFHQQMSATSDGEAKYWEKSLKRLAATVFAISEHSDICEVIVQGVEIPQV